MIDDVSPYLQPDGTLRPGEFSSVKNKLHTDAVKRVLADRKPNLVLGAPPPPVDSSEVRLPRLVRCALSQLRSNFCARLKDFQLRIGKVDVDLCGSCDLFSESVEHLFNCPARPTNLSPIDLWVNPIEVASFLKTHPAFVFLDYVVAPPKRRGRRRPPPLPPENSPASQFSPLPQLPPLTPLFQHIPPLLPLLSSPSSSSSD